MSTLANSGIATEQHFTLEQIAAAWGISMSTARRIFRDQPGVVDLSFLKKPGARRYEVLRIPASVAARIHQERSAGWSLKVQGSRRGVK